MSTTDIEVQTLVINRLSYEDWKNAKDENTLSNTEIYQIEDIDTAKQDTLVSSVNIKTINSESILGSGNIVIQGGGGTTAWGNITGTLSDQTDLQTALNSKQDTIDENHKLDANNITGLPVVNNATLTITQGGVSKGTFTANASNDVIVNLDSGGSVSIDNITITENTNNELQTIAIIENQNGNAIKTWVGTKAQYDALKEQPSYYAWRINPELLCFTTSFPPSIGDTVYFGVNKEDRNFTVYVYDETHREIAVRDSNDMFYANRTSTQDEIGHASQINSNTLYNITDDTTALAYEAYTKNETDALISSVFSSIYPVGAIYIGTQATCPLTTLISGSTWILVSSGRVLQGADANHAAGTTIEAGLPDITGSFSIINHNPDNHTYSGAFLKATNTEYSITGISNGSLWNEGWGTINERFDASNSNSIYGNSTTVQPPAFVVNIWQRTA